MVKRSREEILPMRDDRVYLIKDLVVDILPLRNLENIQYDMSSSINSYATFHGEDRYFIRDSLEEVDKRVRCTIPLNHFCEKKDDKIDHYYIAVNEEIDKLFGTPFKLLRESKGDIDSLLSLNNKLNGQLYILQRENISADIKINKTAESSFWERIKFAFSSRKEF